MERLAGANATHPAPGAGECQSNLLGFDPTTPPVYRELQARCRRLAIRVGLDEALGGDALNEKVAQLLAGDERLRAGQGYFLQAVLHLLQDWARRPRREYSLDACERGGDVVRERERSEAWLSSRARERGKADPTAEELLLLNEDLRWQHERVRLLRQALDRVGSPRFRAALRAQWLGTLVKLGGRQAARSFEATFGISLGDAVGTADLALRSGLPEGTVASDAHRGRAELRRWLGELLEQNRGPGRSGLRPCR